MRLRMWKSGIVDFGRNSQSHILETHDKRMKTSINYIDDFALATWGPIVKTCLLYTSIKFKTQFII